MSRRAPKQQRAMWQIRPERPEDADKIEKLVIASFGAGRFAKTAYRLREDAVPVEGLSFVATSDAEGAPEGGALVGSVRFWHLDIGGSPSLLLGPLAVDPRLRGKGIGIALMQKGHRRGQSPRP